MNKDVLYMLLDMIKNLVYEIGSVVDIIEEVLKDDTSICN